MTNKLFFSLSSDPIMVEQCENAVDDDGDGLIDLNDPDCACQTVKPISLIPNSSFEDYICCPRSRGLLSCAETWIQASAATTDYLNTCNWMGWDSLPVPLPMPDGEACIGYRNGRFNTDDFSDRKAPNYKEYVGACLLSPLLANKHYRFRFNLGFTYAKNSPPTEVAFYGTSNCDNLPFGGDNREFGCPTNAPGWKLLGTVEASGTQTWTENDIDIRTDEDVYAIALGPSCEELSGNADLYYFLDNLTLADQKAFEFEVSEHGNPCSSSFSLSIPNYDSLQYQWFLNGIAILGANQANLQPVVKSGHYQVRITSEKECKVTREFYFQRPVFMEEQEVNICREDIYHFHGQVLQKPGIYMDTLKSMDNCDSIIQLDLRVSDNLSRSISAKIFQGESYKVGSYSFSQPGRHLASLSSELGCDSVLLVNLDFYQIYVPNAFSPNRDGMNDVFLIYGEKEPQLIKTLQIFDRWGQLVYSGKELLPNDVSYAWDGDTPQGLAPDGIYTYSANLLMEGGVEKNLKGSFSLIR